MRADQQCTVRGIPVPGGMCGSIITGGILCGSKEPCEHRVLVIGGWLRNKETGEPVKIVRLGAMVEYRNAEVDGAVQANRLTEHFDVLPGKPADADRYF